jgi:transposase
MNSGFPPLPDDVAALKAALAAERDRRILAEADAASAKARLSAEEALIGHLKLQIEKLKRELYGPRSERTARLLYQVSPLRTHAPNRAFRWT